MDAHKKIETSAVNSVNRKLRNVVPDPSSPEKLFDAVYDSPEHLRQVDGSGQYHFNLLKERIRTNCFGCTTIDNILQVLSKAYGNCDDIIRLAAYLQFPLVLFASERPAERIAQLVDWCIKTTSKVEELSDKVSVEQPQLLMVG